MDWTNRNFYWNEQMRLENNLQQAASAFLDGMNGVGEQLVQINQSLTDISGAPDSLAASVNNLTLEIRNYAMATGSIANMQELRESIEGLTKVANEAVERSMRNETLDTLREQNAKLQAAYTAGRAEKERLMELVREGGEKLKEMQEAVDILNERNAKLQQAIDAKKE